MNNKEKFKLVRSNKVVGVEVKSIDGEKVGKIDDVVVDINRGGFTYVVVSYGGFLGIGNKLIAIPWDILDFDESDKSFTLTVHHDELENATGTFGDSWDILESEDWQANFPAYYTAAWGHVSPIVNNLSDTQKKSK